MASLESGRGFDNRITVAVLGAIEDSPQLRVPLSRKADVNYETLVRYVEKFFIPNELVEVLSDDRLQITDKGRAFLEPLKQAMAMVKEGGGR